MKLWQAWVGSGRFIVRANDEDEAIALARKRAEEYCYPPKKAHTLHAGVDLLDASGEPEVLDVDYS